MGGSLVMARIYSEKAQQFVVKITKDRAEELVKDAILADDPALFKSLISASKPRGPSFKDVLILNKRLNVWLAGTGSRVLDDINREDGGRP
jgi:hypothetical protein